MTNPNFFIGAPFEFKSICKIYPPTVREVLTTSNIGQYGRILTLSQGDIEDAVVENGSIDKLGIPTPIEMLLINSYTNHDYEQIALEAFQFFLHEEVKLNYLEKRIDISSTGKSITENEFFEFQNLIRECLSLPIIDNPPPLDEDPRIARMRAKIRYRDRVKAKQKNNGLTLLTSLVAICCMEIGITPLNIGEMSYMAIAPLTKMYQQREKYNIDIRSIQAGADKKKINPKYWIYNIEK